MMNTPSATKGPQCPPDEETKRKLLQGIGRGMLMTLMGSDPFSALSPKDRLESADILSWISDLIEKDIALGTEPCDTPDEKELSGPVAGDLVRVCPNDPLDKSFFLAVLDGNNNLSDPAGLVLTLIPAGKALKMHRATDIELARWIAECPQDALAALRYLGRLVAGVPHQTLDTRGDQRKGFPKK